jgi:UDP-glucuronate decarboxylase
MLQDKPIPVYGDGTASRDFTFVGDIVRGIVAAMHAPELGEPGCFEVINLGSDEEMTVLELAERIRECLASPSPTTFLPLPEDDPQRRRPDLAKARRILGWEPVTDLGEGLRRTAEWFRKELAKEVEKSGG